MKINDSINLVDKPKAEKHEDFFGAIPDRTQTKCTKQYESLDQSSHPVSMLNSTESLIASVSSSSQTLHSLQNVQQSQIALAQDAVGNKQVELIPHMCSFIVQSNNQKTYCV